MNNAKYLHYAFFFMVLLGMVKQALAMDFWNRVCNSVCPLSLRNLSLNFIHTSEQEDEEVVTEEERLSPEDQELEPPRGLLRQERKGLRPLLEQQREEQRLEQQREAQQYKKEHCQLELKREDLQDPLEYQGEWQVTLRSEEEQRLELEHQKEIQGIRNRYGFKKRQYGKYTIDISIDLCDV